MNIPKIDKLVAEYEAHVASGLNFYMDALDLLDVMDYYIDAGDEGRAEQCLRNALRIHPDNVDVMIAHAYRLKDRGAWDEAREIIETLQEPGHEDVRLFYAEEALCRLEPDKADAIFRELMQDSYGESDYEISTRYAELLLDYGYFERCLETLRPISLKYEGMKRVWELAGEAYLHLEKYELAEKCYQRQVDTDGFDELSWIQLAEFYKNAGKFDKAIESLDYALAINPQSERAIDQKLTCAMLMDDVTLIRQVCGEYISIAPKCHIPYFTLSTIAASEEDWTEAVKNIRSAAMLTSYDHNDRPRIQTALAYCLLHLEHYDEAMELIRACSVAGVDTWKTVTSVFNRQIDKGRPAAALRILTAYTRHFRLTPEEAAKTLECVKDMEDSRELRSLRKCLIEQMRTTPPDGSEAV